MAFSTKCDAIVKFEGKARIYAARSDVMYMKVNSLSTYTTGISITPFDLSSPLPILSYLQHKHSPLLTDSILLVFVCVRHRHVTPKVFDNSFYDLSFIIIVDTCVNINARFFYLLNARGVRTGRKTATIFFEAVRV